MFRRRAIKLQISRRLWRGIVKELATRGNGSREAGTFLLAARRGNPRRVVAAVYFDDLDADSLQGGIKLTARAYGKLWDTCERDGLRVVGDVHTHPGRNVAQSSVDQAHPMVARRGHVALIVPWLATRRVPRQQIGVHVYEGEDGWRSWYGAAAARAVRIGRFW